MRPRHDYSPALEKLFLRTPVVLLDQLRRALGTNSRTTVFRVLSNAGYLTSFSHAGRYYTLEQIPEFDANGLWFWRDVGFSSRGSLRATVTWLVEQAPSGSTHEQLQAQLRLRVHDTLRGLVQAKALSREPVGDVFVYLAANSKIATAQLARRHTQPVYEKLPPLDPLRTIEVLVAVIRDPKQEASTIARRLRVAGVEIRQAQVEEVFERYELEKKTVPYRSRRSRR